jgi:hypothetical protein
MTTTKPDTSKPHNDLKHGPVSAPVNAALVSLFLATIGKFTGVPPWLALAAGGATALCLAWAGRHREPRPLSRASINYRVIAMLTAGGWIWWQLADFPTVALSSGQVLALAVTWPLAVFLTYVCIWARALPVIVRLAVPVVVSIFPIVLTVVLRDQVFAWLGSALTVTDRLPVHQLDAVMPWLGYAALSLAIIAAPMAVLGATFANRERSADEQLASIEEASLPRSIAAQGVSMTKMLCNFTREFTEWRPQNPYEPGRKVPNLRCTDVQFWENGAGETYIIDLTKNQNGTTMVRLRSYTDEIATKLNLPKGCGVEIQPALDEDGEEIGRGFAAVEICRKNVLRDALMYPPIRQRSITEPLPLGQTRQGKEIGPLLREDSAFVCGQKGSGKTITIADLIAGGIQCTDALVWVIDLNGGAAAAPFLEAWYRGEVDRPCIDWVATTIEEVQIMAEVGQAIAVDRKVFYRRLKTLFQVTLMPVGTGGPGEPPPEILIIIDEGAEVLGIGGNASTEEGRAAREALNAIMRLARDAAVNIVFSGLRATADVADTAFKAGTAVRIGMRVSDSAELGHLFGDYKLSSRETPYKGSGYIRCSNEDPEIRVFKAYFPDMQRQYEIGRDTTPWRPYLDERGIEIGGKAYAMRWRRTAHEIWPDPREEMISYGSGPLTDAEREAVAAGRDISGGKVTVIDRPKTGSTLPPIAASFEDMIQQARALDRPSGEPPADPPVGGGGGQPPAGGAGQSDPDEPDGEEAAQEYYDRQFAEFTAAAQVWSSDPRAGEADVRDWPEPPLSPETEIARVNVDSRAVLERLLKLKGPLKWKELHAKLVAGGDWGPPVPISEVAMGKLLKKPNSKEPVDWLLPRVARDPYDHRDRKQP